MCYACVPLTPALSPGQRENRPPSLGKTFDGFCKASVRSLRTWRPLFPLPEGEGQGEGKRRFGGHWVSLIQGIPEIYPFGYPHQLNGLLFPGERRGAAVDSCRSGRLPALGTLALSADRGAGLHAEHLRPARR